MFVLFWFLELVEASKDGTLKEICMQPYNPIIFSYQDVYYELPKSKILCGTIKDKLTNIQHKLS
jgi:hypothetical protein